MASADPSIRDAIRELHIIGHSAGSSLRWSCQTSCKTLSLDPFLGVLVPLLSPCPASCLRHTLRSAKSICTMYWKMNFVFGDRRRKMWHSNDHGIEVTQISGNALWMGKKNHSYGYFVFSGLGPGEFSITKILNVPGVVPLFEKQKAPLRLMSWCTYRMSDSSKYLLQTLSARCGEPATTDELLVSIAHSGLPHVETVLALKQWLLHQLLCQVDGRVLPNYCGVLGEFLLDASASNYIHVGLLPAATATMGQG